MRETYTISPNQVLIKSNDPSKQVKVVDDNPCNNWLIKVEKVDGNVTMMHRQILLKLFRPIKSGIQASLFPNEKTSFDRLKEKHLISE